MKTYIFEIVSHTEPTPEDVLTGMVEGLTADHVLGVSAFTADVKQNGATISQHRFGVLVMADPKTAHDMIMSDQSGLSVINGLLDRFKEVLEGIFGPEAFALAVMEGTLQMLGVDDDDENDDNPAVNPTLN